MSRAKKFITLYKGMCMQDSDVRVRAALLREDLSSFIAKSFTTVNPGAAFIPNWHIDAIADYLTACTSGQCMRLIINMPPRMLKSLSVSVGWPAWLLGHDPARRIIASSYASSLAAKHAMDCKLVVGSEWYRRLFPSVQLVQGQNDKHKFVTTTRGFRLAASTGGALTGEGGQFIIVDDPINPRQAASTKWRQASNRWFDQTLLSRLDNPQQGVVVIVMQRLHEDDLTGHVLAKEGGGHWHQLILPAFNDKRLVVTTPLSRYVYEKETCLHEARLDKHTLDVMRNELGSYAFAAQYMQVPIAPEGGMINLAWFPRFTLSSTNAACGYSMIVQSWDTAIKDGALNDYSVCTTWGITAEHEYYLLEVFRARMDYPSLRKQVLVLAEYWKPDAVLVEDKASGQSLLQDLRKDTDLPAIAIMPRASKHIRVAAVSALIEAGRVYVPRHAAWLCEFEEEVARFPHGTHDDQVDSMSQFLGWVRERVQKQARIRSF